MLYPYSKTVIYFVQSNFCNKNITNKKNKLILLLYLKPLDLRDHAIEVFRLNHKQRLEKYLMNK